MRQPARRRLATSPGLTVDFRADDGENFAECLVGQKPEAAEAEHRQGGGVALHDGKHGGANVAALELLGVAQIEHLEP